MSAASGGDWSAGRRRMELRAASSAFMPAERAGELSAGGRRGDRAALSSTDSETPCDTSVTARLAAGVRMRSTGDAGDAAAMGASVSDAFKLLRTDARLGRTRLLFPTVDFGGDESAVVFGETDSALATRVFLGGVLDGERDSARARFSTVDCRPRLMLDLAADSMAGSGGDLSFEPRVIFLLPMLAGTTSEPSGGGGVTFASEAFFVVDLIGRVGDFAGDFCCGADSFSFLENLFSRLGVSIMTVAFAINSSSSRFFDSVRPSGIVKSALSPLEPRRVRTRISLANDGERAPRPAAARSLAGDRADLRGGVAALLLRVDTWRLRDATEADGELRAATDRRLLRTASDLRLTVAVTLTEATVDTGEAAFLRAGAALAPPAAVLVADRELPAEGEPPAPRPRLSAGRRAGDVRRLARLPRPAARVRLAAAAGDCCAAGSGMMLRRRLRRGGTIPEPGPSAETAN